MRTIVLGTPPPELEALITKRRSLGQDRYDEIWQGEYHMAPAPHFWHGYVDNEVTVLLSPLAKRAGLVGTTAFNLGEPDNFRVPDQGWHRSVPSAVFVPTAALVVEIVSPNDETWQKLDFYAAHAVDELLIADPRERTVTWLKLTADRYEPVESSDLLGISADELAHQIAWPMSD
ncbi:MAG: Uma2 family endonuclease [Acidimicrobiales bacterium]